MLRIVEGELGREGRESERVSNEVGKSRRKSVSRPRERERERERERDDLDTHATDAGGGDIAYSVSIYQSSARSSD